MRLFYHATINRPYSSPFYRSINNLGFMLRGLTMVLMLCATILSIKAQAYRTTAGLRAGTTFGVTVAQRLIPQLSAEAIFHADYQERTYFHLLARRHMSLLAIPRSASFYYGGGLHGGQQLKGPFLFGLDGLIGVESNFFQFHVSADYIPQFNIGQEDWFHQQFAISIRYIILTSGWQEKWRRERKKHQRNRKNYNGRRL